MFSVRSLTLRRAAWAAGALFLCRASAARAQNETYSEPKTAPAAGRAFRLFGLGDFAATGMRSAGSSYWWTGNTSPTGAVPAPAIASLPTHATKAAFLFELQLWMASARSDWLRARDVAPSLENALGGGYNVRMNFQRWMPDYSWAFTGRDGSVGTLFSGVTAERGTGTCRDNSSPSNSNVTAGIPLLAASDCPDTWANPSAGFAGERPVPDTVWTRRFQANKAGFTFEDFKVPQSERPARIYGSFQTFGATNDYGRETVSRFGAVVPGGRGQIQMEGFPMGIEWHFQAFTYAVPAVADVMFYKALVINKSAEVYGVGIDYDSLYLGTMIRPAFASQDAAIYAVPEKGAVYTTNANVNGQNCYGAVHGANVTGGYRAGFTDLRACLSNTSSARGFIGGAAGSIVLASPIGDLRNKKFSDPTSPFYFPAHPSAGDTITFNQNNACGFTCGSDQFFKYNARGAFGAYTNNAKDALGGRGVTSGQLTPLQYYDLFHNGDFPSRWAPGTGLAGDFNKYVPGNWDYNHDGRPDTLYLTTCNNVLPGQTGCVKAWSDTFPGGIANHVHNAYHQGVGPVKLKAGDTTQFVVAYILSADSLSFERTVNNVIDTYQNFWVSAEPPQQVNIVSAQVQGGNRQYDTFIRLYFDQTANTQTDPFLLDQARRLRRSTDPVDVNLRVQNPRLVNQIRARALAAGTLVVDTVPRTNTAAAIAACAPGSATAVSSGLCQIVTDTAIGVVDTIYVFKSCDNGLTYTGANVATDRSCPPSPARDVGGNTVSFPWQAYAKLTRDPTTKLFPLSFRDGNVTAGVTYTYVVVSQSYSAIFPTVAPTGPAGTFAQQTFTIRPAVANGLTPNTANRNVAVVYLPASIQAGGSSANVTLLGTSADTTAAYSLTFALSKQVRGGGTQPSRVVFSDSAEVRVFRADTTKARIDSTVVTLFALADTGGTTTAPRRGAFQRETFTITDSAYAVDVAGKYVRKDSVSSGRAKYSLYRFAGRGPQVTLVANGRPVYVTDSLPTTGTITPPQTQTRTDFNGLLVSVNTSLQRTFREDFWSQPQLGVLRSPSWPTLRWLPGSATSRDPLSFSSYKIAFEDREFGPGEPFTLNQREPAQLQTAYTTSITTRKTVETSAVDAAAASAIATALSRPAITADSLAALSLPFTVTNTRLDSKVTIAVLKSDHPVTALLGEATDTIRVTVPQDRWIPGDRLYFIETIRTLPKKTNGRDSIVINSAGKVDSVNVTRVTWGPAVIGCSNISTCNPISGVGGTGYTAVTAKEELNVLYYAPIGGLTTGLLSINLQLSPDVAGGAISTVTARDLGLVKVVPNPYIMFSMLEQNRDTKRLMFTHLPPKGMIRIYTASGQFLQQLSWTEADLERNCKVTVNTTPSECQATGDLQWDMRTRENLEIGPGFYVFVVSAEIGNKKQEKLGKFVVIH
ncbi:MAG: hypothetical protein WKG32_02070 [Gemmatimonadaceae bacterium]